MDDLQRLTLSDAAQIRYYYPQAEYEKQCAPRLAEQGYLRPIRLPSRLAGMPPPPTGYEITQEGRAALTALRKKPT